MFIIRHLAPLFCFVGSILYLAAGCSVDGHYYSIEVAPDANDGSMFSCVALPDACGASGNDDCCNSLLVDGGMYFRSYDAAGDSLSGDVNYPATISTFRLDKYEVTVGRFRAFVAAGLGTQARPPATSAGAHARIPGSGWEASWNASLATDTATLVAALKDCNSNTTYDTWTDMPGSNETRPINCVTWYEAMAFCAWDGGYLPTEAEWNYAAAGGDQQRVYPWSNPPSSLAIDGSHASYYAGAGSGDCVGDGMPGCMLDDLLRVGAKPAGDGRWGQSDLTGNVYEWTLDYFDLALAYENLCVDCANLVPARNRMARGGSFNSGGGILRTGIRQPVPPTSRQYGLGFRCARPAM